MDDASALTVFGLPLDVPGDDAIGTVTPLCALIVLKALNEDGKVCYLSAATTGLTSVECLGMARYAVLQLETGLAREPDGEGDDE